MGFKVYRKWRLTMTQIERLQTHTRRQRHARAFWHCGLVSMNVVAISACRCGVLHVLRHAVVFQSRTTHRSEDTRLYKNYAIQKYD